jgi:hypothetical protein
MPDSFCEILFLLIGVNDQYQGRPVLQYPDAFKGLLATAIQLAGNDKSRAVVISIHDYGYTPFGASGRRSQ